MEVFIKRQMVEVHGQTITNGMQISQMYRLGKLLQTVDGEVLTGSQDNGTKLIQFKLVVMLLGGDGTECIIDYDNNDTQYGCMQYGVLRRNYQSLEFSTTNINSDNISGSAVGEWVTPYVYIRSL